MIDFRSYVRMNKPIFQSRVELAIFTLTLKVELIPRTMLSLMLSWISISCFYKIIIFRHPAYPWFASDSSSYNIDI